MRTVRYFAFGSNLDPRQMISRCPSATVERVAAVNGYAFAFVLRPMFAASRPAVASIVPVPGAQVWGVIWRISVADLRELDAREGHPVVYQRGQVLCDLDNGRRVLAHTYRLPVRSRRGAPSADYTAKIVHGYREFDLPPNAVLENYAACFRLNAQRDAQQRRAVQLPFAFAGAA